MKSKKIINKEDILSIKPDLSCLKYIPSIVYGSKDTKEKENVFSNFLNKKCEEVAEDWDKYISYYRTTTNVFGEERKTFIVEYSFSYNSYDIYSSTGKTYRRFECESDIWSTNTVGEAILLTYLNFGKTYSFQQKHKNKENIQFDRIYGAFVQVDCDTYIPKEYTETHSDFNEAFRRAQKAINEREEKTKSRQYREDK